MFLPFIRSFKVSVIIMWQDKAGGLVLVAWKLSVDAFLDNPMGMGWA